MADSTIVASPLKLENLLFSKIEVEAEPQADTDTWGPEFDFEGVNFLTSLNIDKVNTSETKESYLIVLELAVLNNSDEDDAKLCPYRFHIVGHGAFTVSEKFQPENREDLIRINGASMLVGAMREVLTQLTARSIFGPIMLPSMRFLPENSGEKD